MEFVSIHSQHTKTRFEKKFVKGLPNDCWLWLGSLSAKGYGHMRPPKDTQLAHRISYELYIGKIPEGQLVRHTCDNPSCVNPAHLVVGTQLDNMQDAVERGRKAIGAENGKVILTADQAKIAKQMLATGHYPTEISRLFGVSKGCIRMIDEGKSWKHVET